VTGLQAVSLGGGQTTTVTLGYTDAVSSTLDVSAQDDNTPF
jgi:hypothetical protein